VTTRILYRVDAGNIVGTGHVKEILSIHNELVKQKDIEADVCINNSKIAADLIDVSGIGVVRQVSIESEAEELAQIDKIYEDDEYSFVILSVLDRSPRYYAEFKKKFGQTIVILDNENVTAVDAKLCINYSILQKEENYSLCHSINETEYWIGPNYFPFSRSIRFIGSKRSNNGVKQIIVSQGGTDPQGLTKKLLLALRSLKLTTRIVVVIGSGLTNRCQADLEMFKRTLPDNYEFYNNLSIHEMHNLIFTSDLALTAAGNTLYELAWFGVPSIVISHHNKHDLVAREFENRGAVINLGIGTEISVNVITKALSSLIEDSVLRQALSDRARLITDGKGIEKLVGYVTQKTHDGTSL